MNRDAFSDYYVFIDFLRKEAGLLKDKRHLERLLRGAVKLAGGIKGK